MTVEEAYEEIKTISKVKLRKCHCGKTPKLCMEVYDGGHTSGCGITCRVLCTCGMATISLKDFGIKGDCAYAAERVCAIWNGK